MYIGLIVFAVVFILGLAAVIFLMKRSDRAFTHRVEVLVADPKPIKRDSI
jgi:hypothetical protein